MTAKHVQAALEDCSYLNSSLYQWATLDIVPTPKGQVVHMRVGSTDMEGNKQKAYQVVSYVLNGDDVHATRYHLP